MRVLDIPTLAPFMVKLANESALASRLGRFRVRRRVQTILSQLYPARARRQAGHTSSSSASLDSMKSKTLAPLAVCIIAVALTGCFPRPGASLESASVEEQLPDNCLTITDGALAKLSGKIAETVPGAEVTRHGLVESAESEMWYVAVEFSDPGLDRDFIGIWGSLQDLTTEEDPAFVAVDEIAEASAEYLQPKDFDKIGVTLPGAVAAEACLA